MDVVIWFNSEICIEGKPFLWLHSFKKGLCRISQLYDQGTLISVKTAKQKYDLSFMEFYALVQAILNVIKKAAQRGELHRTSKFALDLDRKNLTQYVYRKINENTSELQQKKSKWETRFNRNFSIKDFHMFFSGIYKITNVPKLRSFQYRLMHGAIVTNKDLYTWKIKSSGECSFGCQEQVETIKHLFMDCPVINNLYLKVRNYTRKFAGNDIVLTYENVITNKVVYPYSNVKNLLMLLTKYYVYSCRCQRKGLQFNELRAIFVKTQQLEKYIAIKNGKLSVHNKKWSTSKSGEDNLLEENIDDYINRYLTT